MSHHIDLSSLSNPLATTEQLSNSASQLDGIPSDLEKSVRYAGTLLTQAAGILLRLPQEIIAKAIVSFTRFYLGPEGGSFLVHGAKDISSASLYMTAKISALPQSPRSILNVYEYLLSPSSHHAPPISTECANLSKPEPDTYYLSEGSYQLARTILLRTESILLRHVSFNTHVSLPHHLALTYLQTLGVVPAVPSPESSALVKRTLAHLNTALLSPQMLYLTHQPTTLAVAAIYLAAREVGTKLSGIEWWEVFDVEREELGFLIVGLRSCEGWAREEKVKWAERRCPLTVEGVESELRFRNAGAID